VHHGGKESAGAFPEAAVPGAAAFLLPDYGKDGFIWDQNFLIIYILLRTASTL